MIRSITAHADHGSHRDRSNGDARTPTPSSEVSGAFAIARWEDDGGRVLDAGGIAAPNSERHQVNAPQDHGWRLSWAL